MTPVDFCLVLANIFLARTLTPFSAFIGSVFWFCMAIYKGW